MCTALTREAPIPMGCTVGGITPPTAVCQVGQTANTRMSLFTEQYSPANLFEDAASKAARLQIEKNYQVDIQAAESALTTAYPGAAPGAVTISWPDFEACLWDPAGVPHGDGNNMYFDRQDLMAMGMKPPYPIGGALAENLIWPPGAAASPVPVAIDYLMNPDLFTILVFALLVIVFAVLMWLAWRSAKNAPNAARKKAEAVRTALEASDPFKGTPYEAIPDPEAACKAYIKKLENSGIYTEDTISAWRQKNCPS